MGGKGRRKQTKEFLGSSSMIIITWQGKDEIYEESGGNGKTHRGGLLLIFMAT